MLKLQTTISKSIGRSMRIQKGIDYCKHAFGRAELRKYVVLESVVDLVQHHYCMEVAFFGAPVHLAHALELIEGFSVSIQVRLCSW